MEVLPTCGVSCQSWILPQVSAYESLWEGLGVVDSPICRFPYMWPLLVNMDAPLPPSLIAMVQIKDDA